MITILIPNRDRFNSACNWCEENLDFSRWQMFASILYGGRLIFDYEEDAILFNLRWSGQ